MKKDKKKKRTPIPSSMENFVISSLTICTANESLSINTCVKNYDMQIYLLEESLKSEILYNCAKFYKYEFASIYLFDNGKITVRTSLKNYEDFTSLIKWAKKFL